MKKILSLLLILCLIFLAGCKEKSATSSVLSSEPENTVSTVNDLTDPENLDFGDESGAEVKSEKIEVKTGKANGVDVSKWQGKINWKAVKKAGIQFAIIRIGYRGENGVIYKDSAADYNIQQADKAGILIGIYFFSTAKTQKEAEEEAVFTVKAVAGYPISYPIVYNCEGFDNPESRMFGLDNATRTNNAAAFLNYVKSCGYDGMFYASKNELTASAAWETPRLENTFMMWVARYPGVPYPTTPSPDYGGKYDMWQYTDRGIIDGITGNVDLSVSYFTREKTSAKNENARPKDAAAPSIDDKIYTPVTENVTPKIEVNLRDTATTKGNVVATVKNGTVLKRIATGTNGWSKIDYNGKTVYAISSYLTTDINYKPPTVSNPDEFKPATGRVTAKEDVTNLRNAPTTEGTRIFYQLKKGEFVNRIGTSTKGWTKIDLNGDIVYAVSSYLITEEEYNAQQTSSTETTE